MSRRRRATNTGRVRRPRSAPALGLAAALVTLVCACGSGTAVSSGASSPAVPAPAASPSTGAAALAVATAGSGTPTPRPSPQITSGSAPAGAVAAVRGFWRVLGQRRFARLRAAVAPGSPLADPGLAWDIAAARLLKVDPHAAFAVPPYATVEFKIKVFVKPSASQETWGAAGSHTLWMTVTRMSDQSWRVYEYGTGP